MNAVASRSPQMKFRKVKIRGGPTMKRTDIVMTEELKNFLAFDLGHMNEEAFTNKITDIPYCDDPELLMDIYYPEEKLNIIKKQVDNLDEWYTITLYRLVEICKVVSSKYTRSKVRKALPKGFDYIIDELLHVQDNELNKDLYYHEIIKTIINIYENIRVKK